MSKKAQKFSFVMMIVFFLTGIAMTIVAAVSLGSFSVDPDLAELFGGSYPTQSPYGSAVYTTVHPFAKFVFPTILCGLVLTFGITAIWASVLEHFKNVEKGVDLIYRSSSEKEELPDSAYSYMPKAIDDMLHAPKAPKTPAQPMYQQPYAQQPYNQQPSAPVQQQAQPVQPIQQVPVQAVQAQPTQQAQPVQPTPVAQGDWRCPNCGTVNHSGDNFCIGCGRKRD